MDLIVGNLQDHRGFWYLLWNVSLETWNIIIAMFYRIYLKTKFAYDTKEYKCR